LVVLNLPSPPKQTRLEGGSNCESLSSLFMHSTMDKIISLTFLFFLFLFFYADIEFWRFDGGSGPSPHGQRLKTRSLHHLFLESKLSRRTWSTTKRRVLDKKEKKNWIKSYTNAEMRRMSALWHAYSCPIFNPPSNSHHFFAALPFFWFFFAGYNIFCVPYI
jgi:hypothetical protein